MAGRLTTQNMTNHQRPTWTTNSVQESDMKTRADEMDEQAQVSPNEPLSVPTFCTIC